jgi:hypothetical protein
LQKGSPVLCCIEIRNYNSLELPVTQDVSEAMDYQYQGRGDNQSSWKDFFGEENLARIHSLCGESLRRQGYALGAQAA